MKLFKSARHVQRFVSIHDQIADLFASPAILRHQPNMERFVGDDGLARGCQHPCRRAR